MKDISWEFYKIRKDDIEDEDDEEDFDKDLDAANHIDNFPVLAQTPMGLFRVDDELSPINMYEFWMGHTNFPITKSIAYKLSTVLGVEVLCVLSPYRFVLSVGKMFNFPDVRIKIESEICGKHVEMSSLSSIENEEVKERVKSEIEKCKQHETWCLYLFPNGKIATAHSDNFEDIADKLSLFEEARETSGGILITSDNLQ